MNKDQVEGKIDQGAGILFNLKPNRYYLALPANADWKGGSVTIESSGKLPEITQRNNRVQF